MIDPSTGSARILPPEQSPQLDCPRERCAKCDEDPGLAPICGAHDCPYHQLDEIEN